MFEELRDHLPVIIATALVGLATGCFAFMQIHSAVGQLDYGTFSTLVLLVPCVIMFICAFIIVATSSVIGSKLYGTVVGICVVAGILSMIVTTIWTNDASFSAALLANSEEGTEIASVISSPLLVIRDVAAFVVVPTIGSVLGALIGSRLHAMRTTGKSKRRR